MYSLLAALTFFTRLPFWKIAELPKESYKRVVTFWPLTGWLTGGVMCAVYWIMAQMFNPIIAAVFAIVSRLFVTGALHEDGLADFSALYNAGLCGLGAKRVFPAHQMLWPIPTYDRQLCPNLTNNPGY